MHERRAVPINADNFIFFDDLTHKRHVSPLKLDASQSITIATLQKICQILTLDELLRTLSDGGPLAM